MELNAIQAELRDKKLDGWLFYDFHNRDPIAARVLNMDTSRFASRRWYYFIPSQGEPKKLVHRIEPWRCDHLPGERMIYLSWQQQQQLLQTILKECRQIAMQYSPQNAIPYVSIVDAGTIELIRSFGVDVVSSADLVGRFEAHLSMEDWRSHQEAGRILQMVKDETFRHVVRRVKNGERPKEVEIQSWMHDLMHKNDLHWEDGPIVAVNEHAADPHFEPTSENSFHIKEGDLLLLDLWAKKNISGSIYYDITWMAFLGKSVPFELETIFQVLVSARNTALTTVRESFSAGKALYGWQVDDACRNVVSQAGYGDAFTHRTGHNIGEEVHGNGVHIDNLETKDERQILPGTCFSIEPGIYLPERKIGFRSEIDVFVTDDGKVEVTGAIQERIIPLLA
ncbi:MAG: M24 family metallopeptidase [Calditrichaeota bacterium]|nr:MAG: M24 family metallopeptidase [Calditrichota bacterium]